MTIKELYTKSKNILQKAGIDSPAFDTVCLFEKVFGYSRQDIVIFGNKEVTQDKEDALLALVKRRYDREPLQYILGKWTFMGREFFVGDGVLVPRDDTEIVVSLSMEKAMNIKQAKVLDLCSGSGIIAITLEKEIKNSCVTALEKSPIAFEYLEKNIVENKSLVKAYKGDVFKSFIDFNDKEFDLIVSNPPYIIKDEIKELQQEVLKEPVMALDGGADGFDFYRIIIDKWREKLKLGGMLAFELGENQFDVVSALMKNVGFENICEKRDLGNIKRAIIGTLNK